MEEILKELSQRMEKIEENQKLILEKLSDSIIYPNNIKKISSAKTKKEEEREQIEEYKTILINGPLLREKYNLAVTPSSHRILAYLKTKNPSAFDGLKRRS